MTFTPNMSPQAIAEHDKKRCENPDLLRDQGPSVNDNDVKELRRGRLAMPAEAKKSKMPLGDKMEGLKKYLLKGPPPVPGSAQGVISSAPKPPAGPMGMAPKPKAPSNPYRPPGLSPSIKGVDSAGDKESDDDNDDSKGDKFADRLFGKNVPMAAGPTTATPPPTGMGASTASPPMAAAGSSLSTMKSFNSKSLHVFRPLGEWDPHGIQRSATEIPVHRASIQEQQPQLPKLDILKSCLAHGITYKAVGGQCGPCALAKSYECKTCGTGMNKSFGGVYRCPRGH